MELFLVELLEKLQLPQTWPLSSLQWQLAGLILEDFDSEELSVPHLIARPEGHGILI